MTDSAFNFGALDEAEERRTKYTVITGEQYSKVRFDLCQQIAERLGFLTYYQWESDMECRYTTMPAWYWRRHKQGGPEHHYCDYVAGQLANNPGVAAQADLGRKIMGES